MIELSKAQARRIAVRAQWLDASRPQSLVELVDQLAVVQIDPTSAIAPSVDLVCWSRLGEGYDASDLRFALGTERSLVEHGSFVRPMDDIGLVLALGSTWVHPDAAAWLEVNSRFRAEVLALLASDGPLISTEIPDTVQVPWASTGWTNDKNVVRMLDLLMRLGAVAVAGRRGKFRAWDLAERVYPADLVVPPVDQARRLLDRRVLSSLGVGRGTGRADQETVGEAGIPCRVQDTDGEWRLDPAALELEAETFEPRAALLSPFDRLVHDRDRARELFGFEYLLEMYKPAAKRRWGYFALPILYGDALVGKLDAKLDRKAKVLRVNAIHQDGVWAPEVADAVDEEIGALADWLGADR